MHNQFELIDRVLEVLNREGILKHFVIVGSWCLYFYKSHFKEAEILPQIRTLDIDFDVNLLRKEKTRFDIPKALEPLGFEVHFHGDGSIELFHPAIKIEFLVPEKGKSVDGPVKLPEFGITAQPLRFLDLLEEEIIIIDYNGLPVRVPHPALFAIHKLIISQRRRGRDRSPKPQKDINQAIEVIDMLVKMGQKQKVIDVVNRLTKKQKKYIEQALDSTGNGAELEWITQNI